MGARAFAPPDVVLGQIPASNFRYLELDTSLSTFESGCSRLVSGLGTIDRELKRTVRVFFSEDSPSLPNRVGHRFLLLRGGPLAHVRPARGDTPRTQSGVVFFSLAPCETDRLVSGARPEAAHGARRLRAQNLRVLLSVQRQQFGSIEL